MTPTPYLQVCCLLYISLRFRRAMLRKSSEKLNPVPVPWTPFPLLCSSHTSPLLVLSSPQLLTFPFSLAMSHPLSGLLSSVPFSRNPPGGSRQLQAYLKPCLPVQGVREGSCFSTSGPPQTQQQQISIRISFSPQH